MGVCMAKVKVSKTLHGNVKIVLDKNSAQKLHKIMDWSSAIGSSTPSALIAKQECEDAGVEDLAWELFTALHASGVSHADL